ncbi:MAG TPA: class I SAM-dependent methyltransferase [Candidatus Limnocylindrales bacterium]|nr:class I SAM-dependent methyltransferase [Candidatus Limnocylindrales bacterium]
MDRTAWLHERREAVRAQYDAEAATYDDLPYPTTSHTTFIDRLVATMPSGGLLLDAPCGTGQYFARIRGAGRRVVGVDQSAGMLEQARRRGLAERVARLGLQELAFDAEFDGAMTVDAMENVSPEDWPVVLRNLRRAVRPGAHLYMTAEEIDDGEIEAAWAANREHGLPAVRGEVIEGDVAGYHYYPRRERVGEWLAAEGLTIVDQATDQEDGWAYWHLLLRTAER